MPYLLNIGELHIIFEAKFDETGEVHKVLVVLVILKTVSE